MQLTPSDPDIATLYRKITHGRLDLQPNFQRGEVWGKAKKQRLIDSILRGWHIPPVHVIQIPNTDKQEVLDGQQRLAAIRDFIERKFPVNGGQQPAHDFIESLDGMYWDDLPISVRSRLEDFTIRVLTISDFEPGEPGELFYRLNQPTNLTSAEQRNAYFGEARQQVKDLAERMENIGFSSDLLGFSNSRMAYDDVLAKFLLTLENRTLHIKHTANTVTTRYRESTGFSNEAVRAAEWCLDMLHLCLVERSQPSRLNKATVLSWLTFIFSAASRGINESTISKYFDLFEELRNPHSLIRFTRDEDPLFNVFEIYQDRSSSRVADVSSVVLRDLILWGWFSLENRSVITEFKDLVALRKRFKEISSSPYTAEKQLYDIVDELRWGLEPW